MENPLKGPPLPAPFGVNARHGRTTLYANFTPAEHANFLSAKVVAHATAFLAGRNDAALLNLNARSVMCELVAAPDDPVAKAILDPTRLLVVAMMGAAAAQDEARQFRWMHIMASLIDLVRHESTQLRDSGAQRS